MPSRISTDLDKERSELKKPGPRSIPCLALPSVSAFGVAKQLVSNHFETDPNVFTEEQVTLALLVTPLPSTSVDVLMRRGWPDCRMVIELICHPPKRICTGPFAAESHLCPLPNGS